MRPLEIVLILILSGLRLQRLNALMATWVDDLSFFDHHAIGPGSQTAGDLGSD